jgi:alcohol dehydrogenase class IV
MTPATSNIISGRGCLDQLGRFFSQQSSLKLFLVTGRRSFVESGADTALAEVRSSVPGVTFNTISDHLCLADVESAVNAFCGAGCDFVIGVGGGSVMDLAKATSILVTQKNRPAECVGEQVAMSPREVGLMLIPTTAGSGSEATHFSVIYVEGTKHSLAHESMLPDVTLLDPSLTDSLSPVSTATSGLDALCQAIESYWSIRSTDASRDFSRRALGLALEHLVPAVTSPTKEVRDRMMQAANLAGQAINIARTTAAHGASYYLTIRHNVPHGHAVALVLPHLIVYNARQLAARCCDPRGPVFVQTRLDRLLGMLKAETAEGARDILLAVIRKVGLETSLSDVGVVEKELEEMAEQALGSDRAGNNPVMLDHEEMLTLLREAL